MTYNGLGPLGGQRKGENPEKPPAKGRHSHAARPLRGPWATRGLGAARTDPFVKRRHLDKVPPPILLPPPTPGLCSLRFNGQFKFSPQKPGRAGDQKREKYIYSLAISFRYWLSSALAPLPPHE